MTIGNLNRTLGRQEERKAVWLYNGTKDIEGSDNVEQALKMSGMDWLVEQEPLMNPRTGEATRYVFNYRGDNNDVLGVVGKTYTPVQNKDAFDFVDQLAPMGITFERLGITSKGNRMWMCVKIKEDSILGDQVNNHIILTNSHDGSGSLKVTMMPYRLSCHNCLSWVFKRGQRSQALRHTSKVAEKMIEAQQVFGIAEEYFKALKAEAEELSKIKITAVDFTKLSEQLLPISEEDTPRVIDNKERQRYLLKQAWEMDDLGSHRGTGWGFINAVADWEQHSSMRVTEKSGERAFLNVIDNPRMVQTAYDILTQ